MMSIGLALFILETQPGPGHQVCTPLHHGGGLEQGAVQRSGAPRIAGLDQLKEVGDMETQLASLIEPIKKSDPKKVKIRPLSDHIFTKNQTKSGPEIAVLE